MDLSTIANREFTHTITLRGEEVAVRCVPSRIQRLIEEKIPDPPVHGDDQKQVAAHKAKPAYQAKALKAHFRRQCLRAAYAAKLTFAGCQWSDDMDSAAAVQLADHIAHVLSDAELGRVYSASNKALKDKRDPDNAIGTGDKPGN